MEIQEPGRVLQTHWVSSADYIEGTGSVMLTFDPLLKPFLLQLKGNFTSSKLEMLLSFKSQYTMRMYSLLKQHERFKSRELELLQLRNILGLRKDQYTLYSNFKKDILEPTQKELKIKSDIYYEFEEIKYGRKIGAIKFNIFTKKLPEAKPVIHSPLKNTAITAIKAQISTFSAELIKLIPEQHQAKKTVLNAIESFEKKHGFDYVKRNILYCNTKAEKSYAGFLHNALKNDWGQDFELDQKTPVKKKAKSKEIWEKLGYRNEQEYAQAMFDKQMAGLMKH